MDNTTTSRDQTGLNLNLMRQRIQVIQLTITGEKAKAYICPLLSLKWPSNFRLKPANEHPEIISSSKSRATVWPQYTQPVAAKFDCIF